MTLAHRIAGTLLGAVLLVHLLGLPIGSAEVAEPLPHADSISEADPISEARPHVTKSGFRNTNPAFAPPTAWLRLKFVAARLWDSAFHPATASLPRIENDGLALKGTRNDATVTWVGHSTLLIQLDGLNLLTDPQWSDRASPFTSTGPKRLMPPGLRFEDLPPIDLVLISHDHYDHLDVDTVQRLAQSHHPLFIVPLGLKAWFAEIGIAEVVELDWWESRTVKGVTLTCLPAQHFSGRTLWDHNRRLWSAWAVAGSTKRLFFAGDTGYYPVFEEIGRRLGPFDLAAIPIGAYMPREIMKMTHVTPEQALQIFAEVRGRTFVAMHWGTFDLTEEPIDEPPRRLEAEAGRLGLDPGKLWVLKHGETRRW